VKLKDKKSCLTSQLRDSIRESGLSLNEIARQSGVPVPSLSRFMRDERGLSLSVAEKVCTVLCLELIAKEIVT
jgi:transcriptional regulator with XRE-family HTH domain